MTSSFDYRWVVIKKENLSQCELEACSVVVEKGLVHKDNELSSTVTGDKVPCTVTGKTFSFPPTTSTEKFANLSFLSRIYAGSPH
jgi:hypothetical protein